MRPYCISSLACAFALIVSACQDAPNPTAPILSPAATVLATPSAGEHIYIVRFRQDIPNANNTANALAAKYGGRVRHVYTALKGMALVLPDAAVPALRKAPEVVVVVPDGVAHFAGTQYGPTWGLDRVDQQSLPLSNSYTYYNDGTGVTVYIIDTGINTSHVDFGGRASVGFDATGGTGIDCNGHGTHVAGTAGGATYGVAKNVQLVAVKVFAGCADSANWNDVISGVDWVTSHKAPLSVANMSLGGPNNQSGAELINHVQTSIAAGVNYAIAAGNCVTNYLGNCVSGPFDACTRSPSGASGANVVGATDINDHFAYFSNYGSCVWVNAPGVQITSDWVGSSTATQVLDGTSMASPHVAGAAALYLQANPSSTPAQVKAGLRNQATQYRITGLPSGTLNYLLYTLPVVSVSITGPTVIADQRWCTWTANVSGGVPPYTYSWYVQSPAGSYFSPQTGTQQTFQTLGTSWYYTGQFVTTVTVYSADGTYRTAGLYATVYAPGGPYDHTYCH